jgi:hypothetical protein
MLDTLTAYRHPACETWTFCPAVGVGHRIMTRLCRGASQLSETVKRTVAAPLPLPLTIEIHGAPAAALHEHPFAVVIVVVSSSGTDMHAATVTGATEYSHVGGRPDCVTTNVRLATAIAPVRESEVPLVSTE